MDRADTRPGQIFTETREFLENLLEACGDGICITDNTAMIVKVNRSFAEMLGKSREELIGAHIWEIMALEGSFSSTTGETVILDHPSRQSRIQQFEKRFLRHGDDVTLDKWETYFLNGRGEVVPLEITATFQMDSQGSFLGSVCSARDITERRKAEHQLHEAYQFQTRFFTNITHEFRTPLTLLIGPLESMLQGELGVLSDVVKEQLRLALRNSRQLLKLVNQLLDFGRLKSGAKHVVTESRDLNRFAAAILDFFTPVAGKKKIQLRFNPATDLAAVAIDPGKMEKVLFNILGNAFKFTPEGGSITMAISQEREASDGQPERTWVTIAVRDTGIGIRPEDLATIFDRFKQAGIAGAGDQAGSGIGLAHARELVELMGGRISVASQYGKGSTFSIRLPLEPALAAEALPAAADREELSLQPEVELAGLDGEGMPEQQVTGKKPLVLIADDNPDVCRYVAGIVRQDYDYVIARNGIEGLEQLKRQAPDLILCDIMMPGMDGHEFLKQVKSLPGMAALPFIFLTARADIEMKVAGLEQGADDYLVKPFNSRELLARIRSLLRLRELMQQAEAQKAKISSLNQKLQEKYRYGNIIGNSPAMRKIYQMIETIKESDASVLISGETGTGKELVANAIHYNSPRKKGPMVSVNCGAIPRELMEREFFGHVKGAFTGAVESRTGYFKEADQGTLFLDEIGELDKDMQVKLLRALERGEIMRVGDAVPVKVNVRLIAATNKNLLAEVEQGTFREDLYYRIHVIPIHLPPLRQRTEDIPLLIEHFLQEFKARNKKETPRLKEKELRLFMQYAYPGNVRELRHMLERFCLLGDASNLFAVPQGASSETAGEDVLAGPKPLKAAAQKAKAQAEREVLLAALKLCDHDYVKTARRLNICLASLYSKIKEYGLQQAEE